MISNQHHIERDRARIESALVGGAVGGLFGMLIGPIAMLVCAAIGASGGYYRRAD